jgi:hypothetical protein
MIIECGDNDKDTGRIPGHDQAWYNILENFLIIMQSNFWKQISNDGLQYLQIFVLNIFIPNSA